MADPRDVVSLLVVLEFVVVTAIVALVVPFDVVAPLLALAAVFVLVLLLYLS
ncbi:hypothetical protein [Salinigranum salinum]|jgi:hypothetical protein|uniref:hypothetical protein n=1 Tax=Salinigranum salinum TaxID=1364937 RepID=UPI0018647CD7|nr:hypothetical protein [Salinigranum salinum]